jgi:hypothetical protein
LRKIGYILLVLVFTSGCSALRKQKGSYSPGVIESHGVNLIDRILNQNLTSKSFYIERAEFIIRSDDGEKSGLGTMKFLYPDKFLISIKGNSGIEVARIFLSGDSIKINDKMNKRLFYGSTSYLKEKYGVTTSILPVILGDYVNDEKIDSSKINCINGNFNINGIVKNVKVQYLFDCELAKSKLTIPEENRNGNGLEIRYGKFFNVNNINAPGIIEISDKHRNTTIEIRIDKIDIPWEGTIDFIPGRQYEIIRLL